MALDTFLSVLPPPSWQSLVELPVVNFNQRMHAWACIRMVEIDEKHLKIMKKYLFHHDTRGSCKAHEEKWRKKFVVFVWALDMSLSCAWWKMLFSWFLNVFYCFWPCMRSLVEIHWSNVLKPDKIPVFGWFDHLKTLQVIVRFSGESGFCSSFNQIFLSKLFLCLRVLMWHGDMPCALMCCS